ncbi:MAG: hypothetical protein ABSC14_08840 [Desulfomonilia bacterium]|jgi:hypothetical protein
MKRYERKLIFLFLAIFFFIISPSLLLYAASDTEKKETTQPDPPAPTQDTSGAHLNRIDFGNTYIIGQTIKSGAVYLLQRKKSEIKSMLRYREDYRKEILDGFSIDTAKASLKEQKQDQLSNHDRQGGDHLVSQE